MKARTTTSPSRSASRSCWRGCACRCGGWLLLEEPSESLIELGDFRIDLERHQVMVRGPEVHLTPKEFDLLLYFARNADRVLTHKTLLRAVWGAAGIDQPEYLRVLVAQLRKKIEPEGSEPQLHSERALGRLPAEPAGR